MGANIDINPSGSGGTPLHDDVSCKYDPQSQSGTKEFNSGKARLKDRASGAITEINYSSDCKFSLMIEYKLKTEPAHKLFSNQRVNGEIVNKFQKIKEKVSIKHAQMKIKLEKLKAMY
jgi:hypothetical protein